MDSSTAAYENALFQGFPFNQTLLDNQELCTLQTCPLTFAQLRYVPSLPWNAIYLTCFSVCLAIQIFLGVRHRTWSFLGAILGGGVLEVIGYIARIQMHNNVFLSNPFLMFVSQVRMHPRKPPQKSTSAQPN